jgi:hypothetical protein
MKNAIATTYAVLNVAIGYHGDTGTIVSTHKSEAQAIRWMRSAKACMCFSYTGSGSPLTKRNIGETISMEKLSDLLSFGDFCGGSYCRIG